MSSQRASDNQRHFYRIINSWAQSEIAFSSLFWRQSATLRHTHTHTLRGNEYSHKITIARHFEFCCYTHIESIRLNCRNRLRRSPSIYSFEIVRELHPLRPTYVFLRDYTHSYKIRGVNAVTSAKRDEIFCMSAKRCNFLFLS